MVARKARSQRAAPSHWSQEGYDEEEEEEVCGGGRIPGGEYSGGEYSGRGVLGRGGGGWAGHSLQEAVRGEKPWAPLTPCCAVVFFDGRRLHAHLYIEIGDLLGSPLLPS